MSQVPQVSSDAPVHVVPRAERVGLWPRVGASLLDAVILVPLMLLVVPSLVYLEQNGQLTPALAWMIGVSLSVVGLAYTLLEVFKAATPGKMILKLQIASADGTPADTSRLVNRWMIKNGSSILGLIAAITSVGLFETLSSLWALVIFIGCFFVLGEARQAFHDKRAGTAVYRRQNLQETGFQPIMAQPVQASPADLR